MHRTLRFPTRTLPIAIVAAVAMALMSTACGSSPSTPSPWINSAAVSPNMALPTPTILAPVAVARAERVAYLAAHNHPSRIATRTVTGDLLDRLANCESGGNPRSIGGGGRFYGAFQFMLKTWHDMGMGGNPVDYSYADQKAVVARIPVSAWHRQFPVCSRSIGA